ncbi:segregation and condensation protein A [Halonatronum saccharophilum]|uniref:segregation and condensation protein A n=1 Tax=Halonatronum saccharophilum TaxID=150060 RepID=UPI00048746E8|nr:segregation/condensation protein A [Halonatronum saccharophilum]
MGYQVRIDAFEGPIDLLLHLLKKDKVEIYDIRISDITKQYLNYITEMNQLDLEVASEFLVMAARLMEIKAQTLLPKKKSDEEEDEVDPRQQLVERLLEYKKYKELASQLQDFEVKKRKSYTRNVAPLLANLEFESVNPLEDVELEDFIVAFQRVLKRRKKRRQEAKKEEEVPEIPQIKREKVTIKEQEGYIIKELMIRGGEVSFIDLFSDITTRLEVVVSFMALLELIKLKEIKIKQEDSFSDIRIYLLGSGLNVKSG